VGLRLRGEPRLRRRLAVAAEWPRRGRDRGPGQALRRRRQRQRRLVRDAGLRPRRSGGRPELVHPACGARAGPCGLRGPGPPRCRARGARPQLLARRPDRAAADRRIREEMDAPMVVRGQPYRLLVTILDTSGEALPPATWRPLQLRVAVNDSRLEVGARDGPEFIPCGGNPDGGAGRTFELVGTAPGVFDVGALVRNRAGGVPVGPAAVEIAAAADL
ncbi:unnamed protein product, partial [Prorocentrum cordatum]